MFKNGIFKTALFGLIAGNPVFVLVLGMCPTLAMSVSLSQAFTMGVATTFVLVFSNTFVSLLRKIIPEKMRIPCYIVIISTFVIIVEMTMKKFLPELYTVMKTFITLIVVNCIILARAESFASQNKVLLSAVDGLSMGVGFTLSLCLLGFIRELLASGSVFGFKIPGYPVMEAGVSNAFGFITLAVVMAAFNHIRSSIIEKKKRELLPKNTLNSENEEEN